MSEPILGIDCEHDRDDGIARDILFSVATAYPGHSWNVMIRGGIIKISNLDWMNEWGMCFPYASFTGDANVLKRQAVMMCGEFLERANAIRGARTGEKPKDIEGVSRKSLQRAGIVAPDPINVTVDLDAFRRQGLM